MEDEITAVEAAKILGVTPRHVRWYWKKGLLPGKGIPEGASVPRVVVFKRADVEAFVKPIHPQGRWGKPKATGIPRKPATHAAPESKPAAKGKRKKGGE